MKLWLLNNLGKASYEFVPCALLRDNALHHVAGNDTDSFHCLRTLADLVWHDRQELLSALDFRSELERAWAGLRTLPSARLAISLHTQAALQGLSQPPAVTGTVLHAVTNWPLPIYVAPYETVGELLRGVVFDLFDATLQPLDGGGLRVTREATMLSA